MLRENDMNPWFTMYPYLVLHNAGTDRAFCFSICLNQRELGPLAVSHQVPVHFPGGFAARMAHTTRDCPRRMSPAVNTPGMLVE